MRPRSLLTATGVVLAILIVLFSHRVAGHYRHISLEVGRLHATRLSVTRVRRNGRLLELTTRDPAALRKAAKSRRRLRVSGKQLQVVLGEDQLSDEALQRAVAATSWWLPGASLENTKKHLDVL